MNGSPRRNAWFLTVTLLPVLLLALLPGTLLGTSEAAQQVEAMKVIPVQGNVYMLQTPSAGGNVGVLPGPDGVLLVDDQVPNLVESVLEGVRAITDEEIRFVINTHVHMDHWGGNEVMADMGATILAHENVRGKMFRGHHAPRYGGGYGAQPTARYDEKWGQVSSWNAKDIVPIFYNEAGGGPNVPRLGGGGAQSLLDPIRR